MQRLTLEGEQVTIVASAAENGVLAISQRKSILLRRFDFVRRILNRSLDHSASRQLSPPTLH